MIRKHSNEERIGAIKSTIHRVDNSSDSLDRNESEYVLFIYEIMISDHGFIVGKKNHISEEEKKAMMKENVVILFGENAWNVWSKFDYASLGADENKIKYSIVGYSVSIVQSRLVKSIESLDKRIDRITETLERYEKIENPDTLRLEEIGKLVSEKNTLIDKKATDEKKLSASYEIIAEIDDAILDGIATCNNYDLMHIAACAAFIFKVATGNEEFKKVAALLAKFGSTRFDSADRKDRYLKAKDALTKLLKEYSSKEDGTIFYRHFYNVNQKSIHDMAIALMKANYNIIKRDDLLSVGYTMKTSETMALKTIFGYMLNDRMK